MAPSKIHPNAARSGPRSVLVDGGGAPLAIGLNTGGPSLEVIPRRRPDRVLIQVYQRVYYGVTRPVVRSYKRLPWVTRRTISIGVQLYMVLYIFLTVPLRVAFYYDTRSHSETHEWTQELTVFVALDCIADFIGVTQFARFYDLWRTVFYELSTFASLRSTKDRTRTSDTDRVSASKMVVRRLSSANNFQLGRVNWTISSIKPLSAMPGDKGSRSSSQHHYSNAELVLEVIALLPVEVIPVVLGSFNTLHLVRITKLCRLYRLRSCLTRLAKLYSDRDLVQYLSSAGIDSLVRTIALCAGLCHWVACGYMLIAHVQCGTDLAECDANIESSWVVRDRLHGASVGRKYARTLYWASRTLVLLGYDDVTPVSNAETLYVVIVTIMGALFGTSMLANFLFLFRFRNARYAAYAHHVDNAREYMRLQNIPRSVRQQVTAYFNYAWSTHHCLDSEEALHLLPQHLQSKVIATLRANRTAQVCFLMKESVEFINELALALARRIYSPGDQIIEPKVNAQMFFVIRGQVILASLGGGKPNECKTGDHFAEMCLLFPEVYLQRAFAKTFCELYVLTKAKFDEALSEYHRGTEHATRLRMAESLEKYQLQLRKTKKILGLQDGYENLSGRSSLGRFSTGRLSAVKSRSSQGKSSTGKSLTSIGRGSPGHGPMPVGAQWKQRTHWRLPGSPFRLGWDTVRLMAIVYVAFEVPYFAVFISMTEGRHMFVVDTGMDLRYVVTMLVEFFFTFDLILRTRFFAFMDHTVMLSIVRSDLIFAAYKSNGFYLDLLAWLPVGDILDSITTGSLQVHSSIFRLLRLLRLRLLPGLLHELSDLYGASSKFRIVLTLVLGVTLMLHIVGCVWFEMALFPPDSQSDHGDSAVFIAELTRSDCLHQATLFYNCSWVKFDCYGHLGLEFPQENPDSMYQAPFAYLRSIYWAMVTLTAVGYGDIVAYSTAESYFAAFWVFLGGIINFGVMGAMSSTISNLTATHHHHMEKLNLVNSIMERVNISKRLSAEVRRFYHQQFVGHKQAYESQLLSHLPDQLCYQISSLLHSRAVKKIPLFDSASIEFIREVTGKFRHRSYQNGETICLEGDICREFFVFLNGSRANLFFRSKKVPIRALHAGNCYGVNEFLLKRAHAATIIAASHVHASVMSREQFDCVQRKFADDLRDMREEAHTHWTEERAVMKSVMGNLARIKLQPHLLQTPSLFYQRDNVFITSGDEDAGHGLYSISDTFTTVWNALVTFWSLYNAVFVIFRICFHSHLHFSSASVWIADLSCDVCFAVDIYLRLFYFDLAEVTVKNLIERKLINKQYLRSPTFKWDLVASLPIYTPFSSGSLIASLCRLPRLVRCVKLWSYLDDVIVQIQQHFAARNVSAYLSPVKLLIVLVLVAHYVGCIFFLISERECEYLERCWMAHDPVLHNNHSVPILYAKTFYWAITTLLLVGSREIIPRGMAGTLWTGFTCLCCTFVIGHIVGEISELILELGKETKQYKNRIASFENFANEHELSPGLRKRVVYYFRVEFEQTKGTNMCKTMQDLSANLRLKFMLEKYGYSIEKLPISSFLTATQINNLALRLQSELFIPGDTILVEGTFGSRLCTLRKGLAAAYWTKSVASVAVLMENSFFGEIAFFLPNQRRLATVRATTSCEVLYITKQDWQELWIPSDDPSDLNVQKHAQFAILGWVNSRLQRYQRGCLRTASRAKVVDTRRPSIKPSVKPSSRRPSRFFAKDKESSIPPDRRPSSDGHILLWAPTPPRKLSKVEICRMFVSPTVQLLEKKAEYLLSKSTACSESLSDRESSTRRDSKQRAPHHLESSKTYNPFCCCFNGKVYDSSADTRASKTDDLRQRQYIVDLNPINEYINANLGADNIRELETESWARFRLLAALQHVVSSLLSDLIPSDAGVESQSPLIHIPVKPKKPKQLRPFRFDERAKRKWSAAIMQMVSSVSRRKTIGPEAAIAEAEVAMPRASTKLAPVRRRSFPAILPQVHDQKVLFPSSKEAPVKGGGKRQMLIRSRSLTLFGDAFFRDREHYEGYYRIANDDRKGGAGIDFEILQRCQRPQYATQLHWYNRYRRWKSKLQSETIPALKSFFTGGSFNQKTTQVSPLSEEMRLASHHRPGNLRSEVVDTAQLQIPNQQVLRAAITDFQSKQFIRRVKQLGKAWDLVIVFVSVYHLVVTPFKMCFAHEVSVISDAVLRSWSGLEIFLDVLCLVDLVYKMLHALPKHQPLAIDPTGKAKESIRHLLANSFTSEFRFDLVAMLPLELLLVSTRVRLPTSAIHLGVEATNASWWTTRWVLRLNRMLLVRRIQPMSEELIQFAIHDLKLPVSEALLYFLRSVAAYIAMGHLLACIWFITSEVALWQYAVSWLSTPGMLAFRMEETMATDVIEAHRSLSEVASVAFSLDSISLGRQYLRSLLFSLECISTLFYGDILSMNPLELLVEIAITFWSIYIYGALIGAQGERIDAQARQEAAFEQNLAELQHFLNENDVPKGLKRQVKAYYARMWKRHQGKPEFASVADVSRALYEDVVFATQRDFAAQVRVFRALDENFLRGLLVCLEYVVCSEGEEVVTKGDMDRSMYFIAQGRILVRMDSGEEARERGEYFGEFALLYGISRLETCIAISVAELYRLDHEPYERLLQDFPGYRRRNKQSWTTPIPQNHSMLRASATSDASRLTSVMMQYDAQSESVQVLAGDSDGRVFLWSKVSTSGWQLQKVTHESQKLPAVTVAAVTPAETHRRRLYFAAFSDGTLAVFGRGKGSEEEEEVKLLSRLELGVKSIMETMDALVVKGGEGEVEESVLLATGGVDSKVHLFEVADGSDQLTELLALEGHQGWIRSVAFKQQEKEDVGNVVAMLASASQDQRIRVWKVTARSRGQGEGASSGEVKDGFLARGARTTYTVSFDALLVGHEDWVTSVQWTQLPRDDESEDPCETALLSSSMDNTLIVWTKSADTRSSWTPSLRVGEMGGNGLLSAGVLPARGGRLNLLSLSFGGQLERWEQQPVPSKLFLPAISINGHCAEVTDLSWAPRGDYLVSVSLDQTARVVAPSKTSNDSLPNWFEISRAQVHGYDINCGCFVLGNRDANDQFVSGADEKILRVFEAPDEVRQLVGQLSPSDKNGGVQANAEKQVRSVQHAYLPELSLTNKSATTEESASDSDNGYAKLSSSLSLPVGDTLGRKTLWPEQRKLYGHGNELLCVTSSHTGDLIASACKSREERYAAVRLWNTADWSEAQLPLAGHKSSVVQLAFSPNDLYLLSVSRDRQFCLYERQPNSDGKFALVESVKAHRRIIWSCSWSPDSSLFALGSRDQSFSLWSRTSGKWGRICDPVAYDAAVTAVAFLPSALSNSGGYLLAVGLETGAIELFTMSKIDEDVAEVTCSRIDELAWEISPSGAVSRLEWCPAKNEGEFVLAAASSDSSVRVYNLKI